MKRRLSTNCEFNKNCILFMFTHPTPCARIGPGSLNLAWTETVLIVLGSFRNDLVTKMLPFSPLNLGCVFRVLSANPFVYLELSHPIAILYFPCLSII